MKADQAAAAHRHYEANSEAMKLRAALFKTKQRALLRSVVIAAKDHPCLDCGGSYPSYVMDFDHVGTSKDRAIANMVNAAASVDRLRAEIAKCELVCANCHRQRTFTRG